MVQWKPDPSFYPSPRMAMEAAPERHGYVAALNHGRDDRPDVIGGVFLLDHFNFDVIGPWELHRGTQELAYDFN